MTKTSRLVDALLHLCPSEFRNGYRETMRRDVRENDGQMLEAWDILRTAASLHIDNIRRELTYALRTLGNAHMHSLATIVTIALAIGANVAVTSALDAVILQPLPYRAPQQLVFVSDGANGQISFSNAREIQRSNRTFSQIVIRHGEQEYLLRDGRVVSIHGADVTPGYFSLLGTHLELGREFSARDSGAAPVIISDRLWRGDFGAHPVLGQAIRIGLRSYRIVGVAPRGFVDPATYDNLEPCDFWFLPDPRANFVRSRDNHTFEAIGRLRDNTPIESARADVRRIVDTAVLRDPAFARVAQSAGIVSLTDKIVGPVRPLLWLVYATVIGLLIIACSNITNLALVRTAMRGREFAVRAAVGASPGRIVTQLLTESGILACTGGAIGIGIGVEALNAFSAIGVQLLPRWKDVRIDPFVIGYTIVLIVLTTLVTGLLPAMQTRRNVAIALRAGGRSGSMNTGHGLRTVLVIAQVALAFVIAFDVGLLVRSFSTLTHVDLGFDLSRTYVAEFSVPDRLSEAQTLSVLQRVHHAADAIPGVSETSLAGPMPYTYVHSSKLSIPGRSAIYDVMDDEITPGFFHLLRIPLLRGRDFSEGDVPSSTPVAIVDAAFALRYFGTLNVIGREVAPARTSEPGVGASPAIVPRSIIGVVGDTRRSLSSGIAPTVYLPIGQVSLARHVLIRAASDTPIPSAAIIGAFLHADPRVAQPTIHRFDDLVASDIIESTASVALFSALAVIAVLLALAGIYAVTSETVTRQTQQFGVRKALGAPNHAILKHVMRSSFINCIVGLSIGILIAAGSSRFLTSLLFQTSRFDTIAFTGAITLTIACALGASLVPALRAMLVEPSVALRYE